MEKKYYDLIVEIIKEHRKYRGLESILNDIANDVYERSHSIFSAITEESVLKEYLKKAVTTSIITVSRKSNLNSRKNQIDVKELLENKISSSDDVIVNVESVTSELNEDDFQDLQEEISESVEESNDVNKNLVDLMINGVKSDIEESENSLEVYASLDNIDIKEENLSTNVEEVVSEQLEFELQENAEEPTSEEVEEIVFETNLEKDSDILEESLSLELEEDLSEDMEEFSLESNLEENDDVLNEDLAIEQQEDFDSEDLTEEVEEFTLEVNDEHSEFSLQENIENEVVSQDMEEISFEDNLEENSDVLEEISSLELEEDLSEDMEEFSFESNLEENDEVLNEDFELKQQEDFDSDDLTEEVEEFTLEVNDERSEFSLQENAENEVVSQDMEEISCEADLKDTVVLEDSLSINLDEVDEFENDIDEVEDFSLVSSSEDLIAIDDDANFSLHEENEVAEASNSLEEVIIEPILEDSVEVLEEALSIDNIPQQDVEEYSFEANVEVNDDALSSESEFEIQEISESVVDLQVEDDSGVGYQDNGIQDLQIDEITESDNDSLNVMDFNTQIHESYEIEQEVSSLAKYMGFDHEKYKPTYDTEKIFNKITQLDSEYPERQVLKICDLKYNQRMSIQNISKNLGTSQSDVLVVLNAVINIIKD